MRLDIKTLLRYEETTFICHEKHPTEDLTIWGYFEQPNGKNRVWDNVTRLCRGTIVDGDGNIIEIPFMKFFSFRQYISPALLLLNDGQIIPTPPGNPRITEKVDGTMTTLYRAGGVPYLATQRSFTNPKAIEATRLLHEKYANEADRLPTDRTWVFEAIYPETRILIDYGQTRELVLIGSIDKKTGTPLPLPNNTGFPMCRDFTRDYGHIKRLDELAALDIPNQEGFVLYYLDGTMVKVKFPWYEHAHGLLDRHINALKIQPAIHAALRPTQGLQFPRITRDDVFKAFESGDQELLSIRTCVPPFYNLYGFDWWLSETVASLTGKRLPIFPLDETFDFARRAKQPHKYETTMWKWRESFVGNNYRKDG